MIYPYVLGIHFKSSFLCRIPHPAVANFIPTGFGRVIRHRRYTRFKEDTITFSGPKLNPYEKINMDTKQEWENLQLKCEYMSLFRWTDLQSRFGESITGPNMSRLLISNVNQLDR